LIEIVLAWIVERKEAALAVRAFPLGGAAAAVSGGAAAALGAWADGPSAPIRHMAV